jgi:hypothetical protein
MVIAALISWIHFSLRVHHKQALVLRYPDFPNKFAGQAVLIKTLSIF